MDRPPPAPLLTAQPGWREWLGAALVYPLAGVLGTAFLSLGIDGLFPTFLSDDDFATNRVRMAGIFLLVVVPLVVWTVRVNRRERHLAVHADRLTVGRPPRITVPFADITRIRVGAPMPGAVQAVASVNAVLGKVSAKNAGAAAQLRNSYAGTVVVDTTEASVVFHVGTVAGGLPLLRALLDRNPGKLGASEYTDEERARFGRFRPGTYPRPTR